MLNVTNDGWFGLSGAINICSKRACAIEKGFRWSDGECRVSAVIGPLGASFAPPLGSMA
jgi:hypothetical protein